MLSFSDYKVIAVILLVIYIVQRRIKRYREDQIDARFARENNCALPPRITTRWPLGLDRLKELWEANADGRLLSFFHSIAKDYEPRCMMYQDLLAGPIAYHCLNPANLEVVLSTNFKDYSFGLRKAIFAPLIGNGIFTQEGVAWKHSRELLRKQFVRAQYQNCDQFREHFGNLRRVLDREEEGSVVDLQPLFFRLTLDSSSALLFGRSVYSLRADIDQDAANHDFAEAFSAAQQGLAKRYRLAPFHWLYNPRSFRRACATVHRFVDEYIQERSEDVEKSEEDRASMFFFNQVSKESASPTDLRDQLLNVLLAGRDTTACALSWTLRLLVRHDERMARLRREIDSVLGERDDPTRSDIKKMPFLLCVIKESLRLYPPVPLNIREAVRRTLLPTGGGPDGNQPILVRKGELVNFGQYVNARMTSIWGADAAVFRPERWETGETDRVGWGYFPFNGGPRQCLGEDYAMMQISYTVVRLLRTYGRIGLPEGEVVEEVGRERQKITLVLQPEDGCRVVLGDRR